MIEIVKVSVDSNTEDSGRIPVQNINYLGRKGKAEVFFPYGMSANVPTGFLGLLFTILKQSSNRMVMFTSGTKRVKNKVGEVSFFHPITQAFIQFKNDGSILTKTDKCTIVVDKDGTVKIDASQVTITGNLQVDGKITTPTIEADSVVADGKEIAGHNHLAGSPPGNTGPNL